jgi:hypothetical protein
VQYHQVSNAAMHHTLPKIHAPAGWSSPKQPKQLLHTLTSFAALRKLEKPRKPAAAAVALVELQTASFSAAIFWHSTTPAAM